MTDPVEDAAHQVRWALSMRPVGFLLLVALGCGGKGDLNQVASIRMSRSTNSAEVDVAVFSDGSAIRTIGPGPASDEPVSFPAHSPAVLSFLSDLAAVGNVSKIPVRGCVKPGCCATITTVTSGGTTSGDLECLASPTPVETALAADCNQLLGIGP